jgi:signal peptidase I
MFKYNVNSSRVVLEIICLVLIPSLSKNLLLTYWMKKFGILANVIYLSITSLLIFVIPIIPDFNKYLQAVIALVYPIILFFATRKILRENPKVTGVANKTLSRIVGLALFIFTSLLVVLTSGIFKYYFLTIGSGSMEKEIFVGDVVIVKKLTPQEYDQIQVGTILVFRMQNKVVVHRVVSINDDDGALIIKTKGDNNEDIDNWVVTESNLIGLTKYKIPFIGLPSVWLYEFVEGSKVK